MCCGTMSHDATELYVFEFECFYFFLFIKGCYISVIIMWGGGKVKDMGSGVG